MDPEMFDGGFVRSLLADVDFCGDLQSTDAAEVEGPHFPSPM